MLLDLNTGIQIMAWIVDYSRHLVTSPSVTRNIQLSDFYYSAIQVIIWLPAFLSVIQLLHVWARIITIQLTEHSAIGHIFIIWLQDMYGNQIFTVLDWLIRVWVYLARRPEIFRKFWGQWTFSSGYIPARYQWWVVVYFDQQMHAYACVYMVENNKKRYKIVRKVGRYK